MASTVYSANIAMKEGIEEKCIRKARGRKQRETMTEDDRRTFKALERKENIQAGCQGQRKAELNKYKQK